MGTELGAASYSGVQDVGGKYKSGSGRDILNFISLLNGIRTLWSFVHGTKFSLTILTSAFKPQSFSASRCSVLLLRTSFQQQYIYKLHPAGISRLVVFSSVSQTPVFASYIATGFAKMASNSSVNLSLISQNTSFPVSLRSLALFVVALAYWTLSPAPLDPAEPPLAKARIPLIGHLIGIIRYEAEYFQRIRFVDL